MSFVAIITALPSELQPQVRQWPAPRPLSFENATFKIYQRENLLAVAAGIGRERAQLAARALVSEYRPSMLVSAGFAGALIPSLKAGSIFVPSVVVDARDGHEYRCSGNGIASGGILVTASEIAGPQAKCGLVDDFHALVVDMEAAAVAGVAQQAGIPFCCVKAITDEAGFVMPPLQRFVNQHGHFVAAGFIRWLALHPRFWPAAITLARNSRRAGLALADWITQNLGRTGAGSRLVKLEGAEFSKN